MISEVSKKWVEAMKKLTLDVSAQVSCPECHQDILHILDIPNPYNSSEIERAIYCPKCGAKNYIRMNKK